MAAALPEVHESDAPPETEAIYAGLRDAIGVPIVNLVWRHFATLPGVLPWMWTTARGAIGSATVADGSARMAALVAAAPEWGLADLAAAWRALPTAERTQVSDVVQVYNRGNLVNLQVLSAVQRLVASGAAGKRAAPTDGPEASPGPLVASLPSLPRMAELPGSVRAEVSALAALHDPTGPVVPSLYRHLALWPVLLPPLRAALAPRFAERRVAALGRSLLGAADESAAALLPGMAPPGPFPAEHRDAVLRVLAVFPGKLIAEMAVVGLALGAALSSADAP